MVDLLNLTVSGSHQFLLGVTAVPCLAMIGLAPLALRARENHGVGGKNLETNDVAAWSKRLIVTATYTAMMYCVLVTCTAFASESAGWILMPVVVMAWGAMLLFPLVTFSIMLSRPELFPLITDKAHSNGATDRVHPIDDHSAAEQQSESFVDGAA